MSDEQAKRYIVWLCAGCHECEPQDGSEPATWPCIKSPSLDGAEVVRVEVLESAERELQAALDMLGALNAWLRVSTFDEEPGERAIYDRTAALLARHGRPPSSSESVERGG